MVLFHHWPRTRLLLQRAKREPIARVLDLVSGSIIDMFSLEIGPNPSRRAVRAIESAV